MSMSVVWLQSALASSARHNPPTVVFLPGAMCSPRVFEDCARHLDAPVLAIPWLEATGPHALPTDATRVLDTIRDAVGERGPVVLVGHSAGSSVAILAAEQDELEDGALVAGLVVSNTGASTRGHKDLDSLVHRIEHGWGPEFWNSFVERCVGPGFEHPLLDHLRAYPEGTAKAAAIDIIRNQASLDLVPNLRRIRVPSAIVHGRWDAARTLEHATEMANALDGSELAMLLTGHTSCLEDPSSFAHIVQRVSERAAQRISTPA